MCTKLQQLKLTPNPTPSQRRKLITAKAASFSEELRLAHTLSLKQQSVWLQWAEVSEPFDLSWRNLIWGNLSTHVLKFFLNATVNWVRTPALLHLWGYKHECRCCLCGANTCALHHILSNCNFLLTMDVILGDMIPFSHLSVKV